MNHLVHQREVKTIHFNMGWI